MIGFIRPLWLLLFILTPLIVVSTPRGPRRRVAATVRAVASTLLVLAVAGIEVRRPSDRVDTVFVLDISQSVSSRGSAEALAIINRSVEESGENDTAALVTAGEAAAVEERPRSGRVPFRPTNRPGGGETDISDGIYRAMALLPGRGEPRIVLVSDGNETRGDAASAAALAASAGISVDVLPLGDVSEAEVWVRELSAPPSVREGELHDLVVRLESRVSTALRLVVLRDGEFLGEETTTIPVGETVIPFSVRAPEKGIAVYEVLFQADRDNHLENNRGLIAINVEGPSRLLYTTPGSGSVPFLDALEHLDVRKEIRRPGDLPSDLGGLSSWDTIVMDNVPATDISLATMDLLETWVRVQGGGLMMLGGDASFGMGGWYRTPLENALPVDMDVPSSLYIPSLAMVLVIDKSGSMGGTVRTGETKLAIVKEAVLGAVEVLNPFYEVGLIAFDGDTEWTIPMIDAKEYDTIRDRLGALEPGGGTKLFPALEEGYARLAEVPAGVRHLIVLTDGLVEDADFASLVNAMRRDDISVSTVAVGEDADTEQLREIAIAGDGRFWFAEDATKVPRIFASESMIVSKGLVVEETIIPIAERPSEALEGFDPRGWPPIHGYILTYPKETARVALTTPRGHPLLAFRDYGLGRTVSYASDWKGAWGRDFVSWESFPRLIHQILRWTERPAGIGTAEMVLDYRDGAIDIVVEARDVAGGYLNDLDLVGEVAYPDGTRKDADYRQTAPGRYEARLPVGAPGLYVVAARDSATGLAVTRPWTAAYSPEYRIFGANIPKLTRIAAAGGGKLLTAAEVTADGYWSPRTESAPSRRDPTPFLALAALLLLVVDVALRQIPAQRSRRAPPEKKSDMEEMILSGLDGEKKTAGRPASFWFSGDRRPTAAEAARYLAVQRQQRKSR